jgi:hypothetical protein
MALRRRGNFTDRARETVRKIAEKPCRSEAPRFISEIYDEFWRVRSHGG